MLSWAGPAQKGDHGFSFERRPEGDCVSELFELRVNCSECSICVPPAIYCSFYSVWGKVAVIAKSKNNRTSQSAKFPIRAYRGKQVDWTVLLLEPHGFRIVEFDGSLETYRIPDGLQVVEVSPNLEEWRDNEGLLLQHIKCEDGSSVLSLCR